MRAPCLLGGSEYAVALAGNTRGKSLPVMAFPAPSSLREMDRQEATGRNTALRGQPAPVQAAGRNRKIVGQVTKQDTPSRSSCSLPQAASLVDRKAVQGETKDPWPNPPRIYRFGLAKAVASSAGVPETIEELHRIRRILDVCGGGSEGSQPGDFPVLMSLSVSQDGRARLPDYLCRPPREDVRKIDDTIAACTRNYQASQPRNMSKLSASFNDTAFSRPST